MHDRHVKDKQKYEKTYFTEQNLYELMNCMLLLYKSHIFFEYRYSA
jgi:hypothetical protein